MLQITQAPSLDRILLDLIRDGARIGTLEYLTGISRKKLQAVWHRLHYAPPPKGQLPKLTFFLKTKRRHQHASILAQILTLLPEEDLLIKVHAGYRLYVHAMAPDHPICGADYAVLILKSLREGEARIERCPECGGAVLVPRGISPPCCYCHATTLCHLVPNFGRAPGRIQAGLRASPVDEFKYRLSDVP